MSEKSTRQLPLTRKQRNRWRESIEEWREDEPLPGDPADHIADYTRLLDDADVHDAEMEGYMTRAARINRQFKEDDLDWYEMADFCARMKHERDQLNKMLGEFVKIIIEDECGYPNLASEAQALLDATTDEQ